MIQTVKVKKVTEQGRPGYNSPQYGQRYIHLISFESPVKIDDQHEATDFQYHSTKPTCTSFVAGQDATFEASLREKNGYKDFIIKPVFQKAAPVFSGAKKYEPKDEGRIAALSCLSSAANYYHQRQATEEKVIELAETMFKWALSKSTLK